MEENKVNNPIEKLPTLSGITKSTKKFSEEKSKMWYPPDWVLIIGPTIILYLIIKALL